MAKKKQPIIDPEFAAFLKEAGITDTRLLPTGEWAGLQQFMFTTGLMVGLQHDYLDFFRTRFCYKQRLDARRALEAWDGTGDPSGPWVKQKPENRPGPGLRDDEEGPSTWRPSLP